MWRFLTLCDNTFPGAGDVWFSLNGTTYQNNSIVTLEDIGGSNEGALLCRTNLTACCKHPYGPSRGNWFLPDGSRVSSDGSLNTTFTRTRDKMVLRLKHTGGGLDGIYRCDIPDSMNITQTIYIGVYTANTSIGEWYMYDTLCSVQRLSHCGMAINDHFIGLVDWTGELDSKISFTHFTRNLLLSKFPW